MASRETILNALGEAREHLILNKYNDAMMLMAQITIDVIEHLTDEALIVSKGYEEDLNTLKTVGILADDTAHNFETIIISGVQAHNGVEMPKEHVEQALQVLTNELDLIFKKEDSIPSMSDNLGEKAKFNAESEDGKVFEYEDDEDEPYKGDFSSDNTLEGSTPAFLSKEDDTDFRKKEKMREQLLSSKAKKPKRSKKKLIAIIIPIILVLAIVFVVRAMFFQGPKRTAKRVKISEIPTVEVQATTTPETTVPVETEPPAPAEAGFYNVTGNLVKIRSAPTTENSRVLAQVNRGEKVSVQSFYNNEWAEILYEGNTAYISRRYIERDTSISAITNE